MPILVQDEHIEKGIKAYNGIRSNEIETLFANGNLETEVYAFKDGRFLVCYKLLKKAFLYSSKTELMEAIVLD